MINSISEEYKRYLQSDAWQSVRAEVIKRDNAQCKICGSKEDLQVHHICSKYRFNEKNHIETLMLLCNNCHETIHKYFKACDVLRENKQNDN